MLQGRNRNLLFVIGGLLAIALLTQLSPSIGRTFRSNPKNLSLPERLALSEKIYQRSIAKRPQLKERFLDATEPYPGTAHGAFGIPATWWDFAHPAFTCPHDVERIGFPGDGGKWVCGFSMVEPMQNCVVYSFGASVSKPGKNVNGAGVSWDSSFEAELLERAPGCQIWGYDFSVTGWGPDIKQKPALASRAHFHPYRLDGVDNHGPGADPPTYTLESLMKENGHDFIHVLKVDIEGSEFEVFKTLVESYGSNPLPFAQLEIEIHALKSRFPKYEELVEWQAYNVDSESGVLTLHRWKVLENHGLRPFWNEPNLPYFDKIMEKKSAPDVLEYSFINIRGSHYLIS